MTQYAIITDLNRCVGCLACTVACKAVNGVDVGSFWIKTLRIGPNLTEGGSGQYPDVEMYFLPVQCQHCADPECVKVCPTGASQKMADGTVQIDKSKCIGCQFCAMSCPYNVRYLNEEEKVVEKCTLCEQKIAQGELPQCVSQCGSRARFFGDVEQGIDSFEGPAHPDDLGCQYDEMIMTRATLKDYVEPYNAETDVHYLTDVGNKPQIMYLLRQGYGDRRDRKWRG
ncbi:MAG: 4Fe-4S dicluster domain-containing protein [Raoultibacter sp.]